LLAGALDCSEICSSLLPSYFCSVSTYRLLSFNSMATENEGSKIVYESRGANLEKRNTTGHRSIFRPFKRQKKKIIPSKAETLRNGPSTPINRTVDILFPTARNPTDRTHDPDSSDGCVPENKLNDDAITATAISPTPTTLQATYTPPTSPCTTNHKYHSARASTVDERTIKGMRVFNQEVDDGVVRRFREVQEQVEPALIQFLYKTRIEFRPLALQLLVLGLTADVAKPWIVVYCPKEAKSKVKSFFRKDVTKAICHRFDVIVGGSLQPSGSDTPDEVLVAKANLEAFEVWTPQIKVMQSGVSHYATMGGVVCVIHEPGWKLFYGLTVGHVLPVDSSYYDLAHVACEDDDDEDGEDDGYAPSDGDSASDSDDDESAGREDLPNAKSIPSFDEPGDPNNDFPEKCAPDQDDCQWHSLGLMSTASYSPRARNRDWALIRTTAIKNERLQIPKVTRSDLYKPALPHENQLVQLHNNSPTSCTILGVPARAILPSGHKFVDIKVLQLSRGQSAWLYLPLSIDAKAEQNSRAGRPEHGLSVLLPGKVPLKSLGYWSPLTRLGVYG
jgi:hypothetical protein